jgi:flagellar operon protein
MTGKEISSRIKGQYQKNVASRNISENKKSTEFKEKLLEKLNSSEASVKNNLDKKDVEISQHAAKRLKERNVAMDGDEFFKLKEAISKLQKKGGQDSLVVTSKAAYIVDVPNRKIVTAIDKDNLEENVFTKIDSTMIIN